MDSTNRREMAAAEPVAVPRMEVLYISGDMP